MKKKTKRKLSGVVAIALVLSIVMISASSAAAASGVNVIANTPIGESIHKKINISDITGEIAEPPMLTSAASSVAEEKEWYEYVYYSSTPVGYYYLNDVTRLSFFDPYDYANSLIMEVDDSLTDWSSNNTLQISYSTGNSISDTGKSTSTTSTIQKVDGQDTSTTTGGDSTVTTTVEGRINTYNHSKTEKYDDTIDGFDWEINEAIKAKTESETPILTIGKLKIGTELDVGSRQHWTDSTTHHGEVNTYNDGWTENNTTTTAKTEHTSDTVVTSTIADRLTKAVGTTTSSNITMTTNNSTTITKAYNAGYFNANGSPLQWKIIKYTVLMPMKYQIEYLVDGEWIFGDFSYCLLTTIQGTCRAWLQNNVAYYEHWGTGEAVTWNEFWSQFFTKDSLVQAYKNKLYPDN